MLSTISPPVYTKAREETMCNTMDEVDKTEYQEPTAEGS
jgi:hypothetical protein